MRQCNSISLSLLLASFMLVSNTSGNDEVPGAKQAKPIALIGGTVHTISGESIENGIVVFDQGKIVAVGTDVEIPDDAERIQVEGKHVYPALFESKSQIGLVEVESVRATIDTSEIGNFNPNVTARVAVNPDSEVIPVTRSNGVLLAVTAPSGGVVAGKSSILQLDGWTYEDLTVDREAGLHMRWPSMTPRRSFRRPVSTGDQNRRRDEQLEQINRFFDDAEAYGVARAANPVAHPVDLKLEAMLPVLAGEVPLIVEADDLAQIEAAVAFAANRNLKLIIFGGYDAPRCADLLNEHNVPVIVSAVYRRPLRSDDGYDAPYTLANRLREAGIQYCISGYGRNGTANARNLPHNAGTAVAFGLPRDEAIKAITLYPAEILGVADRVGSLEAGKDATLFVTDGDPLETVNDVSLAYIQGRLVELSDKHKRLYEKYAEKYRRIRDGE